MARDNGRDCYSLRPRRSFGTGGLRRIRGSNVEAPPPTGRERRPCSRSGRPRGPPAAPRSRADPDRGRTVGPHGSPRGPPGCSLRSGSRESGPSRGPARRMRSPISRSPASRRDDFKDDGGGRKRLAEWPTHASPHGHAEILERSPSPAAPLFVSLRRNEKHNVLPAIVRIEAKGWAIEFGGGPSRSCSTTSPCATRRSTNSRRLATGSAWP